MKKLLLLCFITVFQLIFSQDTIALSQDHFIDATGLVEGKLVLKKWTKDANENGEKNLWNVIYCDEKCMEESMAAEIKGKVKDAEKKYLEIKEKYLSETVQLPSGTYNITRKQYDIPMERIVFKIDSNGNFENLMHKDMQNHAAYIFKNGMLVSAKSLSKDQTKTQFKEVWEKNIYTRTQYHKNGNVYEIIKANNSIKDKNSKTITTTYSSSVPDQVSTVNNTITKVLQEYYRNGKLWKEHDEKKDVHTTYKEDGSKTIIRYHFAENNSSDPKDQYNCQEEYNSSNILISKLCKNSMLKKEYTYNQGKLARLKVSENAVNYKVYDGKGNLLENVETPIAPSYR
ncbi:hypothetical protein [Chryseobacterium phocaeense]|uniref:hypothetical protein n=1 Tax=Chryseobacterium phocaeense TaxID=1816690 RepID=UPI0009B9374C|nr:hypothetical protein [Chryseobacterium phocaeense]